MPEPGTLESPGPIQLLLFPRKVLPPLTLLPFISLVFSAPKYLIWPTSKKVFRAKEKFLLITFPQALCSLGVFHSLGKMFTQACYACDPKHDMGSQR